MKLRYFAYGSNMLPARLAARVPSAVAIAPATMSGYVLRFHKRGQDGSAKCNAVRTGDPAHCLHGVMFEMLVSEQPRLDRAEGAGYEPVTGLVRTVGRCRKQAFFYVANDIDERLLPWRWYRDLVFLGAQSQGLPAYWCRQLRTTVARPDPLLRRALRNRRLLAQQGGSRLCRLR